MNLYKKIQICQNLEFCVTFLILALAVRFSNSEPDSDLLTLDDAIELSYFETEIKAWHFHTYFFEVNNQSVNEMLALRYDFFVTIK